MKKTKLQLNYFKLDSGRQPVREFLEKELTPNERNLVESDIIWVETEGIVGPPVMKYLEKRLWEIRTKLPNRQVRIFCVVTDGKLVLLHGIIKKKQKTPKDALDLALKRAKIVEAYLRSYNG